MRYKGIVKTAFIAGFNASSEGFNGEYGATDEQIEEKFEEWFEGEGDISWDR